MSYLEELFGLKNKIAVITGGNGQLGTEYAKALISAGAKVAIFDMAEKLNEELQPYKEKNSLLFFKVDITNKDELKQCLQDLIKTWGVPEILINNAALDSPPGAFPEENRSFEDYSFESWEKVLNVNLSGVFLCCQIIGGEMANHGGGSIINISSIYGLVSPNQNIYKYREERGQPFIKPISYSATKAAILNLTRYLATYWAPKKVRVNTLVPGGIFNDQDEQFVRNYSQLVPLGRMARKDECNGAVLFLASGASSYVTGSTLVVDGGWTAW